ncbi:hypothetical protein ACIBOV_21630 [Micromonospora chersina]|uniref:hypothetical protein n=1 Tax=Micromonospora chersina TaxID=47854 RepID=UPI0037A18954
MSAATTTVRRKLPASAGSCFLSRPVAAVRADRRSLPPLTHGAGQVGATVDDDEEGRLLPGRDGGSEARVDDCVVPGRGVRGRGGEPADDGEGNRCLGGGRSPQR